MASNSTKWFFTAVTLFACSAPAVVPTPASTPVTLAETSAPENVEVYRDAGFIVGNGSIPFIGMVRYVATEFLDSTGVLVALSVPPRSLSFVPAGDRYRRVPKPADFSCKFRLGMINLPGHFRATRARVVRTFTSEGQKHEGQAPLERHPLRRNRISRDFGAGGAALQR